jgi:hypothetical protein
MTRPLPGAAIATIILTGGCGQGNSPADEQAVTPARQTQTLHAFARSYLVHHVCPDTPTPEKLARRIAEAVRDRPGTTWGAAAMGICNKTRH